MIKSLISFNSDYENAVKLLCTILAEKYDSAVIIILRSVLICLNSVLPNAYAVKPELLPEAMNLM